MPIISKYKLKSPHKLRWEWYDTFLSNNTLQINRILHVDAFDSFFFGDPFSLIPKNDEIYFQSEEKAIKSCSYNKQWLLDCHPNVTKEFLRNKILCSGSLAGGRDPFHKFVKMMISAEEWSGCWKKGSDQGDFNYIFWKNYKSFPYRINIMNCSSGFTTMHYCTNKSRLFNSKNQLVAKGSDNPIIYSHQYNRYEEVVDYINSLCPKS